MRSATNTTYFSLRWPKIWTDNKSQRFVFVGSCFTSIRDNCTIPRLHVVYRRQTIQFCQLHCSKEPKPPAIYHLRLSLIIGAERWFKITDTARPHGMCNYLPYLPDITVHEVQWLVLCPLLIRSFPFVSSEIYWIVKITVARRRMRLLPACCRYQERLKCLFRE